MIAWNEETGDIRSGQIPAEKGYGYWIIKFDGVDSNGDHELEDDPKYTLIEYAYYLMATEAGIKMNECRLLREKGRNHFMTKRFDRTDDGKIIHMQTLGALAHINYNTPCLCSYEQLTLYARQIGVSEADIEQIFRRMVFNRNFSFLMNRSGQWSLSPAYAITFAYNPENKWISAHQMNVNGKNTGITEEDLLRSGSNMDISTVKCKRIIEEVSFAIKHWPEYAGKAGLPESIMEVVYACINTIPQM